MCLEDILTWMVNIEQMYSPPAHTPANQSQVQNNPTPANVVAGAIDIEQYAEKALSYDSSIQPSQVVRTLTPTSKNRFADTNSSDVHTLEWVTEQYNGSNQETKEDIIEFYPATAAVCFSRYTSKSLTEWFIHATSGVNNTTEQDSSSKLKVGDPNDQQSKFAIIPADATPTWIKAKDGYVLLNTSTSDVDDVTIYAVLETPTAEYTPAATVSSWCRYDEHQEEWVVYDDSGSEYRYTTKQDLESAWSFIQLPKSQDTTPNYTINANNIGEIGLPHQPTGILLGRDIYKKAREEWNEVKKTKNTSTEHSSDPEQTADVNELKDILNQIAEDESDVYLVDPKNDDVEDLYDRLPPHILENATWIRSEEIDEKTLKSINLLEPTIGKDHPRYNDAVESIVANIKSQLQINEYWGPVMDDIIGTILRAMIRSEKIYAGSDLYEVLTNTGRRNQFAQSIEEEGVELTSDEEYLIDKQIEKYTKRISEMDQEDIDPVVRRLKDYIEH